MQSLGWKSQRDVDKRFGFALARGTRAAINRWNHRLDHLDVIHCARPTAGRHHRPTAYIHVYSRICIGAAELLFIVFLARSSIWISADLGGEGGGDTTSAKLPRIFSRRAIFTHFALVACAYCSPSRRKRRETGEGREAQGSCRM